VGESVAKKKRVLPNPIYSCAHRSNRASMQIAAAVVALLLLNCASADWLDHAAAHSNSLQTTWTAAVSPRFRNVSRLDIISMMGVPMQEHEKSLITLPKSSASSVAEAVPAAFAVYEQWPQCTAYIKDQGAQSRPRSAPGLQHHARFYRPVRLLLGIWHGRIVCGPSLHRQQRVHGGAPQREPASCLCCAAFICQRILLSLRS
jgi:hypothetical protein